MNFQGNRVLSSKWTNKLMLDKTQLRVWSTVWETSFSKIRTRRTKQTCLGKEDFASQNPRFGWGCSTETIKPWSCLRQWLLISLPCLTQETFFSWPKCNTLFTNTIFITLTWSWWTFCKYTQSVSITKTRNSDAEREPNKKNILNKMLKS